MSRPALSNNVELDDMLSVGSNEETKEFDELENARLNGEHHGSSNTEDANPLLSTGFDEDDKVPTRWKDDVSSSGPTWRRYLNWRNACAIAVVAVVVFLVFAVGAVIYKSTSTAAPASTASPALTAAPSPTKAAESTVVAESNFTHVVKISPFWKGFDKIDNWFAFGDSWTDNNFHAWEAQPSRENPFGNPDVASRDIWNYCGFLTLQNNHSLIKTWDLAWSASTVDSSYDRGFLDWLDFKHQVHDVFQRNYITNETGMVHGNGWTSNNTLFSAFFGINDVFVYNHTTPQWTQVFDSYASYLEDLYSASARIFLVINIPPVNLAPNSPGDTTIKDNPEFRKVVSGYNDRVADMVQRFIDKHDDATVFAFDLHKLIQQIHDDPKSMPQTVGIKDVSNFCPAYKASHPWYFPPKNLTTECRGLELQEYLWRDELHTTVPIHKAIATEIERMFMHHTTS